MDWVAYWWGYLLLPKGSMFQHIFRGSSMARMASLVGVQCHVRPRHSSTSAGLLPAKKWRQGLSAAGIERIFSNVWMSWEEMRWSVRLPRQFKFMHYLKMSQSRPLFRSFQTNINTIFTTNQCEKCQFHPVPGFEPTTSRASVSSHNH